MKTINTHLVIIALFLLTAVSGYSQDYEMNVGDTLYLHLATYRGTLQWQESTDNISWNDIAGATYQPYYIVFSTPKYYRGKVTENSCNPIYSMVYRTTQAITSITDLDGNTYDTIRIGTQVWFKQNLKTTKYNDGTAIPHVTDNTAWAALTTPAYSTYNNTTNPDTINTYGLLYNWYTVNTTKLCPTGYHVPTDAEWTTLTTFLGGESGAGSKLKEVGTTHWNAPNSDATNETYFTALPGGYRNYDGTFYDIGLNGYWWSSTESDATYAWFRSMSVYNGNVSRGSNYKSSGLSVRCVRDF